MRYETKVFIAILLVVAVGLSIVNFLGLTYLRLALEEGLEREINYLKRLYPQVGTPPHIVISEDPLPPEGFTVSAYTGKYFIFLKKDYVKDRLRGLAFLLLLWDAFLIISLSLLLRRTLLRYMGRERELKDLFHALLMTVTHRIGNFISVQKLNVELLGEDRRALRLRESLRKLEGDYTRLLETLLNIQRGGEVGKERLDIRSLVVSTLSGNRKEVRLILNLREGVFVDMNPIYGEILIQSLLENALKYARSFVHVKLCRTKDDRPLLLIRNDRKSTAEGGSGMGLQIVNFLASKMGVRVSYRVRGCFTAIVEF